jgi:Lon protease-like protein
MSGCLRRDDVNLTRALEALPLFPLPGTVFFPHTLLPLHVFEPRYRQMTEAVIAGHQHMAVVLVDDAPSAVVRGCKKVAGLGRIVHHERLPDGRFHILLQGIGRVELDDELPMDGLLYRRCPARLLDAELDSELDADAPLPLDVQREMTTLRTCYTRLMDVMPECKDTLADLPLRIHDPGILADIVNAAVLEDIPARQAALEEISVARRLKSANDALATLLLRSITTETVIVH